MTKTWGFEVDGQILEALPAGKFKVKPKDARDDVTITCYKSWKMKRAHISILENDWVKLEVNQYDMTQGRIVYRYNEYPPKTAQGENLGAAA